MSVLTLAYRPCAACRRKRHLQLRRPRVFWAHAHDHCLRLHSAAIRPYFDDAPAKIRPVPNACLRTEWRLQLWRCLCAQGRVRERGRDCMCGREICVSRGFAGRVLQECFSAACVDTGGDAGSDHPDGPQSLHDGRRHRLVCHASPLALVIYVRLLGVI